ncbi:hypothetical protein [Arthrobacter zhaoguopingii]|uniref:hypothetical protein n=1 Tax=Arthrobacter zhaoguopingii TaxID=2681491 RepID=UPI001358E1D9|nr:hypothetical protein [Arthrobacter zhaoguopingii]
MSDVESDSSADQHPDFNAGSRFLYKLKYQPSLDWSTHGDEFISRLGEALAESVGHPMTRSSMRSISTRPTPPYRRYEFHGLELRTALAAFPLADGSWCLGLEAASPEEASLDGRLWAPAIRRAEVDLGHTTERPWWAVVVPVNPLALGIVTFDEEFPIPDIELRRSANPYTRYRRTPGPRPLGGGGSIEVVYPIVMHGKAFGYRWEDVAKRANAQVLDTCACLTLGTGALWEVTTLPQPHELDPASLHQAEDPSLRNINTADYNLSTLTASSTFIAAALAKMQAEPEVAELIAAYYHARSIEETSQSMAAVVYVSIIETIGSRSTPLSPCLCCENCNQKIGFAKRFREALKLVVPENEAKRLSKLYEKRSRTAHQGTLHGSEFRLWSMPNSFMQDPADHFLYNEVWHVRAAAGKLLRLLVGDGLPTSA